MDFKNAHVEYEIAVASGFLPAYNAKAYLYLKNNETAPAISLLLEALKRLQHENNSHVKYKAEDLNYAVLKNLAWAKLLQWSQSQSVRDLQEAKRYLQKAIEFNGERAAARCLLALIYENERDRKNSFLEWKRCRDGIKVGSPDEKQWLEQAKQRLKVERSSE